MRLLGRFYLLMIGALLISGCSSMRQFSPSAASQSIREAVVGAKPDKQLAKSLFAKGEVMFTQAAKLESDERQSAFRKAAGPYESAAERSPGTPVEEDALMMVAESHFFADDYVKAGDAYDELVKRYPSTRHMDQVDQRRFAIAQYWLTLDKQDSVGFVPNLTNRERPAMDTFGYAIKMYDKIRFDDPTGKLADDATMAAAIANFERHKYGAADILFTDVRENFPSSEHQFQAHLLGLKCKQLMYEGPDYDGGVLDEGVAIIKQIYRLFPNQVAEQKEYLETVLKDLRLRMAQREYSMAEFYDKRSEYGAARMYYQAVREKFADTNLAKEAETRLEAIGELPAVPEQSMEWLVKAFPEEGPARPLIASDIPDTLTR